ncbi:hypothetical protein E2542_SST17175 [Spatholobus suberectus]|nr:hypothetical protein E2542_SST17175 [Spatholobus suberectus]
MADSTIKILNIVFFLVLISQGYSKCSFNDLTVSQSRTGIIVQGYSQWLVVISNTCPCSQVNVLLNCTGFQSVEHVDPSLLRVSGSICLLNNGLPIYKNVVKFKYAWAHTFPIIPISSYISCPQM